MEGLTEPTESDREECWTVKVAYWREPHGSFPLSVRQLGQDFPFKSQPASHDVCLIIETEGKTRAETGHIIVLVNQIKF